MALFNKTRPRERVVDVFRREVLGDTHKNTPRDSATGTPAEVPASQPDTQPTPIPTPTPPAPLPATPDTPPPLPPDTPTRDLQRSAEEVTAIRAQLQNAGFSAQELVPYLRMQPLGDRKAHLLAEAIEDQKNAAVPFAALCAHVGYDGEDFLLLVDLMERYHVGIARLNAAPEMVTLVRDVVRDGLTIVVPCPTCIVPNTRDLVLIEDCPDCGNTRQKRKPGDRHSRGLIFESFGLTGKGKGQTNIGNIGSVNVSINGMQRKQVSFGQQLLEAGRGVTATQVRNEAGGTVEEAEVVES